MPKITKKVKKEGVKQEKIQLEIKPEEIQPEKETIRTLKEKPRTDFVLKIFDFLKEQKIDIVEEREIKKKELSVVVKVDSSLGKINFLCIAKDKKTVTPDDLRIVLQKSQMVRMPALILYVQEPNKKTLEYAEKWASLLKLMKIDNNKI